MTSPRALIFVSVVIFSCSGTGTGGTGGGSAGGSGGSGGSAGGRAGGSGGSGGSAGSGTGGGSAGGSTGGGVNSNGLVSIALLPDLPNLGVGATLRFQATGTYDDGGTRNIAAQATWSSNMPAVAPITAQGLATATTMGTTTITASLNGINGTTTLTVGAKKLVSIAVTPRFLSLIQGASMQLTATGTYTDGTTADVTSTVTWESVDSTYVSVTTGGRVTGAMTISAVGVFARSGAVEARSVIAVTSSTFALISLSMSPSTIYVGESPPMPRVDADFGGIGSNYVQVSWSSSNTAVATVDTEAGRMQALTVGTSMLTASTMVSDGGIISVTNTLTVSNPPLTQITIAGGSDGGAVLAQGGTLQLSATGVYANSSLNRDLTSGVTWSSNNATAISVDSTGLVHGLMSGTATITATSSAVMGTLLVTVPSTVPPQQMVTLNPVDDNTVGYSSLNASRETTAFPVNCLFTTPGLGVGCAWFYSPPIGPSPEHLDASCYQALIKFDLSSLAGKTIVNAKLRLTTSVYGVGYVPRRWFIYALATQWGPTVTWYSSSSFQHYVYSQTDQDPPIYSGQIYDIDETNTVRNWVAGSYLNAGFELGPTSMLLPQLNTSSLDAFEFHSKEDSGGRGPKLIVTYQ